MLEKIDKFIDRFLNWRILKNLIIAELFLIPNSFIATLYNIPWYLLIIMNLSFNFSVIFLTKVIKEIASKH